MSADEAALEQAADDLLKTASPDPERPIYTERQLARRTVRIIPIDEMLEITFAPPQSLQDELRFLASVSHMNREHRRVLDLWVRGWNQREIATAFKISQQFVSQRLRRALGSCYDSVPISFRRFSHHTIYQKRRASRDFAILRQCANCQEEYPLGNGMGRYCSQRCREMARHTKRG